jgi:hypothetical protein
MLFPQTKCLLLLVALSVMLVGSRGVYGNPPLAERPVSLTGEERQWLAAHPELRLAPDPDFPPIEWIDSDQEFMAEYCRIRWLNTRKVA